MLYPAMQLNKIFYRENRKSINKTKCQITLKQKPEFSFWIFPQKLLNGRKRLGEGKNEQEKERTLRNTDNRGCLKFYRKQNMISSQIGTISNCVPARLMK